MSQQKKILDHLKKGKSLTPLDALNKFGCFRLGARIFELRDKGWIIQTKPHKTKSGAIVASYSLVKE